MIALADRTEGHGGGLSATMTDNGKAQGRRASGGPLERLVGRSIRASKDLLECSVAVQSKHDMLAVPHVEDDLAFSVLNGIADLLDSVLNLDCLTAADGETEVNSAILSVSPEMADGGPDVAEPA